MSKPSSCPNALEGSNAQQIAVLSTRFNSMEKKIDTILENVQRTNGRVSRLELWKMFLMGGGAVIMFLLASSEVAGFIASLSL